MAAGRQAVYQQYRFHRSRYCHRAWRDDQGAGLDREGCEIRNGCYIRENVIIGNGVVAGNSCEFKNCLVFDEAQVPHYNYVGDSILGYKAHLGAGVILSNVKLDKREVSIIGPEGKPVSTGLRKFGAIVGDEAEVGCNSVLSPGSIIGRRSILYPGIQWRWRPWRKSDRQGPTTSRHRPAPRLTRERRKNQSPLIVNAPPRGS